MADFKRLSELAALVDRDFRTLVNWAARSDFPPVRQRHGVVRLYSQSDFLRWHDAFQSKRIRRDERPAILNVSPIIDPPDDILNEAQ